MEDSHLVSFEQELEQFRAQIRRSSAVNVNSDPERDAGRALVQHWFREIRPGLVAELGEDSILPVDAAMQDLLRLVGGRNRRASYLAVLDEARGAVRALEYRHEMAISQDRAPVPMAPRSAIERRILSTLESLVPAAALSYEQAIRDLADPDRVSFRGTANELRSTLWDVLDRLAPDEEVAAAPDSNSRRTEISRLRSRKRASFCARGSWQRTRGALQRHQLS